MCEWVCADSVNYVDLVLRNDSLKCLLALYLLHQPCSMPATKHSSQDILLGFTFIYSPGALVLRGYKKFQVKFEYVLPIPYPVPITITPSNIQNSTNQHVVWCMYGKGVILQPDNWVKMTLIKLNQMDGDFLSIFTSLFNQKQNFFFFKDGIKFKLLQLIYWFFEWKML